MRFWRATSLLVGGVSFVMPALAQRAPKPATPAPAPTPRSAPPPRQPGAKQEGKKAKMAPLPAPQLQRLMQMTPEQREKALSRLPPEQRQQVEQRLNQFDKQFRKLPPEQQKALQDRYDAFSRLPQGRRTAIREELQQLRTMRPAQRAERLNSDEAKQSFSPEELGILRGVAGVPEQ